MSPKNIFLGLIIVALLFGGYYLIRNLSTPPIKNLDSKGATIVAFGDSLIYGYGSTSGHDFVSLLSTRIGLPIVNLGVSGNTTTMGLARIQDVLDQNPRLVIVLLGGNDYLRRIPRATTFANLDTIVNTIQEHGAAVLLLGIRGGLLYDSYDDDFRAFARSHGVGFVPNVLDGLLGDKNLMSDEIHPNDAGYAKVMDKVEPVLRSMLEKR